MATETPGRCVDYHMSFHLVTITSFQLLKLKSLGVTLDFFLFPHIPHIKVCSSMSKETMNPLTSSYLESQMWPVPFLSVFHSSQDRNSSKCHVRIILLWPTLLLHSPTLELCCCCMIWSVPSLLSSHTSFHSPSTKEGNPTWSCICLWAWMLSPQIST